MTPMTAMRLGPVPAIEGTVPESQDAQPRIHQWTRPRT